MMPLWVPLTVTVVVLVGAGGLLAVSHRTGLPELAIFAIASITLAPAVLVMLLRLVPPSLAGGADHPVRDWTMLLTPWILLVVGASVIAVRERLSPHRPATPSADCRRCQAELYEDFTGRGRFYSEDPVSYLCPEQLQLPGDRRHDPVPRAIAASVRD